MLGSEYQKELIKISLLSKNYLTIWGYLDSLETCIPGTPGYSLDSAATLFWLLVTQETKSLFYQKDADYTSVISNEKIQDEKDLNKLIHINDSIIDNAQDMTIEVGVDLEDEGNNRSLIRFPRASRGPILDLLKLLGIPFKEHPNYDKEIQEIDDEFNEADKERRNPYGYYGVSRKDF